MIVWAINWRLQNIILPIVFWWASSPLSGLLSLNTAFYRSFSAALALGFFCVKVPSFTKKSQSWENLFEMLVIIRTAMPVFNIIELSSDHSKVPSIADCMMCDWAVSVLALWNAVSLAFLIKECPNHWRK